jgi:hypothetical protein
VAQLLTGLAITWPNTNGNLNNIKMGGTTIYNTATPCCSLTTSALLGTIAQRTIAANGASATVTFNFQNNVDTNANNYTGSATFNPFGIVTDLP